MKIKNPWGLSPKPFDAISTTFLSITGTTTFLGENRLPLTRHPYFPVTGDAEIQRDAGEFAPIVWALNGSRIAEIEFDGEVQYEIVKSDGGLGLVSGEGTIKFKLVWSLKYSDRGVEVSAQPERKPPWDKRSGSYKINVEAYSQSNQFESSWGYVKLFLRIVGGHDLPGISFTFGGVTLPEIGRSSSRDVMDFEFNLKLFVPPFVQVKANSEPPIHLMNHIVFFEKNKFDLSDNPNGRYLSDLKNEWINRLMTEAPKLHKAIVDGKVALTLNGHASKTGTADYDSALSEKRIQSVSNALKLYFRSEKLDIRQSPMGHRVVRQSGESSQEKRVEISINEADARREMNR